MKNRIGTKRDVGELLGISESEVLRLMRNQRLPRIYLTRATIRFDLNEVQKWADTRPVLRKTSKQQAEAKQRREDAEARRREREDAEFRRLYQQRLEGPRLVQLPDGQREAVA
jgi:predicted DNA-binding transcriptional regulator AlpA